MTDKPNGERSLARARALLSDHPVLGPLALRVRVNRLPGNPCPGDGWAVVSATGRIYANPDRAGTTEQWARVMAHVLLHLGLGHLRERPVPEAWNAACDVVVERLLGRLGLVTLGDADGCRRWAELDEEDLYHRFCSDGVPEECKLGTAGSEPDMLIEAGSAEGPNWTYWLAQGLRRGAGSALRRSTGRLRTGRSAHESPAQQARSWFLREYPLLGALASAFTIVEDVDICRRYGITVAAVRPALREIYLNPGAGLDADECRFVVAHELLHVGLLHHRRRGWRHPFLWNIACDCVVNDWLLQMGVGAMPAFGGHHDLHLRGLSAEAVYAHIADRLDDLKSCGTFRGLGVGDMLAEEGDEEDIEGDALLRRCLVNGLAQHRRSGRGELPAGLMEEVQGRIRAPIPWDVQLGRWFDARLDPRDMRRSYAHPSRRQSATPDIPRPRVASTADTRTFGVVLDTSGSMERGALADALGAIAGYALAQEVAAVRLVFCDAAPYDRGYVPPEALLDWVDIRGRGGTVLQRAVDLLEEAPDFPPTCPILVITDGLCDSLAARREHAFLLPPGRELRFPSAAPVFEMS